MNRQLLLHALKASSPAFFGYVSLGLSFGFVFSKFGAVWYLAPLMSLFVYAGAAQFIAISLLAANGSMLQILGATFFVNLRHIFYGLSFLGKFSVGRLQKSYMIFGLTDESYAILTSMPEEKDPQFLFAVILFSHSYWVLGSLIGSIMGAHIPLDLEFLEFSLVALFVILTIEQAYNVKKVYPFAVAVIACILANQLWHEQLLIVAISLAMILLILLHLWKTRHDNH